MKDYKQAMEHCAPPADQEQRLKLRILAAEPVKKQPVIRPMSAARKALLAAALAVLLSVSVGAAVLVDWDAIFTERFGQTAAEVPGAETLFQAVNAESVCGDVTLRVTEALGDSQAIYFLLEYQLPEGTDLELVGQAWGSGDPARQLHLPSIAYYATDAVSWGTYEAEMGRWWPDIEWRPQFEGADYLTERNEAFYRSLPHLLEDYECLGGGTAGTQTVDFDPETGTMRFLAFYNRADGGLTETPLTVLVYPPSVTVDGETTALADHPALITFQPTQTAKAKTGELRGEDFTLRVTVSPFAIHAEYYGGGYSSIRELAEDLVLVYRSGAEQVVRPLSMGHTGSVSHSESRGVYGLSYHAQFDAILNAEEVVAIRLGGREFALTEAE